MKSVVSRIVALLVAVGLVVGAVQIRRALDDDSDVQTGVPGPSGGADAAASDRGGDDPVVACSLPTDVCDSFGGVGEVAVAPAWSQALALIEAEAGDTVAIDAWLVPSVWVEMVRDVRELRGAGTVLGEPAASLGRSPMVVVVPGARADVLTDTCDGAIGWACIGARIGAWSDLGGEPGWGPMKPAHPPPTEALGLLTVAQAVTDRVGTPAFSLRDLEDPEFAAWFTALERATTFDVPAGSLLEEAVATRGATVDIVGTTEAEAARLAATAEANGVPLDVTWPEPLTVAELVVVPVVGREDAAATFVDAAADVELAGWRQGDGPPAQLSGAPPLPRRPQSASGGALFALVEAWLALNLR